VEGVDLPADLGVLVLDVGELLLEVAEPGRPWGRRMRTGAPITATRSMATGRIRSARRT